MPNHVHGIVTIRERVTPARGEAAKTGDHSESVAKELCRAQHAAPLRNPFAEVGPRSIPALVRSFKAATTKQIRETLRKPHLPVWQRGYYEHVIRDADDFGNTYEYIPLESHTLER
jgi:putative transposase